MDQRLFVYGTLRKPPVQLEVIGRLTPGAPDRLVGWTLDAVEIVNPEVLRISEQTIHYIARRTQDPTDAIEGEVLMLTEEELLRIDPYEADNYVRSSVVLESGTTAWFYCRPEDALVPCDPL